MGMRWLVFLAGVLCVLPAGAEEEPRNSKVFTFLEGELEGFEPQLAWDAATADEHAAWRKQFRAKLVDLLGGWPEPVAPEVYWDENEVLETDKFTRRKVYVRSEANYWAPAYYFVPRNITGKRPAVICFHGHSGIMPYIREGTDREKRKGEDHHLDYAPPTSPSTGKSSWPSCNAAGTKRARRTRTVASG